MEVLDLVWLPANIAKLASHGIAQGEVRSILEEDDWVVYIADEYPEQARIVGPTQAGRFLTIVLDPTDWPSIWRPVTGWPSTGREMDYHREQMAR